MNPLDPFWHHAINGIAFAHIAARQFGLAVESTDKVLSSRPDNPIAQRIRAIALAHLDRLEEARRAAMEAMALQPKLRMSNRRWSFRDPARNQIFYDGGKLAGLPE